MSAEAEILSKRREGGYADLFYNDAYALSKTIEKLLWQKENLVPKQYEKGLTENEPNTEYEGISSESQLLRPIFYHQDEKEPKSYEFMRLLFAGLSLSFQEFNLAENILALSTEDEEELKVILSRCPSHRKLRKFTAEAKKLVSPPRWVQEVVRGYSDSL